MQIKAASEPLVMFVVYYTTGLRFLMSHSIDSDINKLEQRITAQRERLAGINSNDVNSRLHALELLDVMTEGLIKLITLKDCKKAPTHRDLTPALNDIQWAE